MARSITGPLEISEAKVAATRNVAEYAASLACDFLERSKLVRKDVSKPSKAADLPLMYMLEMGAALLVLEWRNGGMLEHCEDQNAIVEALIAFLCKADVAASSWSRGSNSDVLSRTVFKAWLNRFAWSARQDLGVDMLLGSDHEIDERQLNEIAETLWKLRRTDVQARKESL